MAYLDDVDLDTFRWSDYLARYPEALLSAAAGRRAVTELDPLAFALIYLRHHLVSDETGGVVSLSAFHVELCRHALTLSRSHGPSECRTAWVAPRGSGKSTWGFLILPLWALAHGHRRFVAAFADSSPQAQQHLASLKRELDVNPLLREDFPDLCRPARRESGTTVADRQDTYLSKSGAAFVAKGIDSSTLGAKIGSQRPDLLLFDDVEPDESNYSSYQKDKRLSTIVDAVFPMNLSAVVMFLGTTTMPGSIIHDLVRQVTDRDKPNWPQDERIDVRYFPAILANDDGTEASLWPARWSLAFLQSIRHTQSYAKNFANQPAGYDGGYWQEVDIVVGDVPALTRRVLAIDPAVTSKRTSDDTGIAVVSYSPTDGRCLVEHAEGVKLTGGPLRDHLARLIKRHPGKIHGIVIETNAGGDLWREVLDPLGLKVITHHSSEAKEIRFASALDLYQKPRPLVVHADRFPVLEAQMLGFPRAPHDDVVDAVCAGIAFLVKPQEVKQVRAATARYA